MWPEVFGGVLYVYIIAVVRPTIKAGLIKPPEFHHGCTWWEAALEIARFVCVALFGSIHLTARHHKAAPGQMKHTVTNEKLAALARLSRVNFDTHNRRLDRTPSPKQKHKTPHPPPMTSTHHAVVERGSMSIQTHANSTKTYENSEEKAVLNSEDAKKRRRQRGCSSPAFMVDILQEISSKMNFGGAGFSCSPTANRVSCALPRALSNLVPDSCKFTDVEGDGFEVLPRAKLIVVLDIDECLIHTVFSDSKSTENYRQREARPDASAVQTVSSISVTLDDGVVATVNRRPGLEKFLEALALDYTVIAFTAGKEEYSGKVLDALDPKGVFFHKRLYRESCRLVRGGIYVKDLTKVVELLHSSTSSMETAPCTPVPGTSPGVNRASKFSRQSKFTDGCDFGANVACKFTGTEGCKFTIETGDDPLARILLVDNSPLSFICQPENGLLVGSWYDNPDCDALGSVLRLIRHLDMFDDIRPTLSALFGLEKVLKEYREFVLDRDEHLQPDHPAAEAEFAYAPTQIASVHVTNNVHTEEDKEGLNIYKVNETRRPSSHEDIVCMDNMVKEIEGKLQLQQPLGITSEVLVGEGSGLYM